MLLLRPGVASSCNFFPSLRTPQPIEWPVVARASSLRDDPAKAAAEVDALLDAWTPDPLDANPGLHALRRTITATGYYEPCLLRYLRTSHIMPRDAVILNASGSPPGPWAPRGPDSRRVRRSLRPCRGVPHVACYAPPQVPRLRRRTRGRLSGAA